MFDQILFVEKDSSRKLPYRKIVGKSCVAYSFTVFFFLLHWNDNFKTHGLWHVVSILVYDELQWLYLLCMLHGPAIPILHFLKVKLVCSFKNELRLLERQESFEACLVGRQESFGACLVGRQESFEACLVWNGIHSTTQVISLHWKHVKNTEENLTEEQANIKCVIVTALNVFFPCVSLLIIISFSLGLSMSLS